MASERDAAVGESKHHFKIGEVAEMLGVKPHVLRYWEQEFTALGPKKTRGAHRHYSRENVAYARRIHALVVEGGYSIAGARARLTIEDKATPGAADAALRDDLETLRDELALLLDFVEGRVSSIDPTLEEDEEEDEEDVETPAHVAARARTR